MDAHNFQACLNQAGLLNPTFSAALVALSNLLQSLMRNPDHFQHELRDLAESVANNSLHANRARRTGQSVTIHPGNIPDKASWLTSIAVDFANIPIDPSTRAAFEAAFGNAFDGIVTTAGAPDAPLNVVRLRNIARGHASFLRNYSGSGRI